MSKNDSLVLTATNIKCCLCSNSFLTNLPTQMLQRVSITLSCWYFNKMQWIYIVLLLLLGTVWCHNKIPEDLEDFGNKLSEMPPSRNFIQSAIPSTEDVYNDIKQKCEKNGGTSSFENFVAATDDSQKYVQSHFNFTQIQEEFNKFYKNSSMDEEFAKLCFKISVVQEYIRKLTIAVESCLDEEEKSSLKLSLNITDSVANFACHKDGDRIAMFVAEGGFECIQSKKEGIEECISKTLSHHTPNLSFNYLLLLVTRNESCNDYENLQSCIVSELETCEDNTPVTIIKALFKYIRQTTPCKNHTSVFESYQRVLRSYNNQRLNVLRDVFNEVNGKYEPHCLKNGGQIAADEFRQALDQVNNCSTMMHSNFMKKVEEAKGMPFEYLCNDFRFGIRGCLSTLTVTMGACSSPQEAYAPKFGIDLYDSIFNFYCKDDARALKKFLRERDVCMNKIHNSTRFCLNKTKHIEVYAKDNVVTKTELCSDLKTLRSCFLDVAAQQCSNNATTEFVVGFSDAVYEPCAGCKIFIPSSLLFFLFLFKVILKM